MKPNRVYRYFQIAAALNRADMTVDTLSQLCKVSRRTIYRDLRSMREAGFMVAYDRDQLQHRFAFPIGLAFEMISREELLCLYMAVLSSPLDQDLVFVDYLRSAMEKLGKRSTPFTQRQMTEVLASSDLPERFYKKALIDLMNTRPPHRRSEDCRRNTAATN